eukprot:713797-Amphidinium_carterae.1
MHCSFHSLHESTFECSSDGDRLVPPLQCSLLHITDICSISHLHCYSMMSGLGMDLGCQNELQLVVSSEDILEQRTFDFEDAIVDDVVPDAC